MLSALVGIVAPMVAVLPFTFALKEEGDGLSKDGLIVSSIWLGCILG